VTADTDEVLGCDGLVVPGVGAFAACMTGLLAVGGDKLIAQRVALGRPVLGICVGMQVLFSWPGTVERVEAGTLPLPHMGWNTVSVAAGSALFTGIPAGTRFYFVHSYALRSWAGTAAAVSWTTHGEPFAAAVEQGVLSATQFHPEKSGDAGAALLSNWVRSLG
jgi:glutamine amidotransferase